MADNETTADIIAWLRKPREGENAYLTLWRDEIADRLEAAHKREIEEITYAYDPSKAAKSKAPDPVAYAIEGFKKDPAIMRMYRQSNSGDAAKLREALTKVKEWMEHRIATCGFEASATFPTMLEDVVLPVLAAPPRNCDVYTSDELKVKFNSELDSELPIANEHEKNLVAITAMGVIDTLLAPATEKEGGNDAD